MQIPRFTCGTFHISGWRYGRFLKEWNKLPENGNPYICNLQVAE